MLIWHRPSCLMPGWPSWLVSGWLILGWFMSNWFIPRKIVPGWFMSGKLDWFIPSWFVSGWLRAIWFRTSWWMMGWQTTGWPMTKCLHVTGALNYSAVVGGCRMFLFFSQLDSFFEIPFYQDENGKNKGVLPKEDYWCLRFAGVDLTSYHSCRLGWVSGCHLAFPCQQAGSEGKKKMNLGEYYCFTTLHHHCITVMKSRCPYLRVWVLPHVVGEGRGRGRYTILFPPPKSLRGWSRKLGGISEHMLDTLIVSTVLTNKCKDICPNPFCFPHAPALK